MFREEGGQGRTPPPETVPQEPAGLAIDDGPVDVTRKQPPPGARAGIFVEGKWISRSGNLRPTLSHDIVHGSHCPAEQV